MVAFTALTLFAAPAVAHAQRSASTSTSPPKGTTLDFANARLADVIRTLASMLGRTVVVSDIPDARVTFSTASSLKPGDLEAILESLLESHGLMLVNKGNVSQVLPSEKAPATGTLRTGATSTSGPRDERAGSCGSSDSVT